MRRPVWVASGLKNVDGPTAIIEAARFCADDIFLDLWMPGMDGYEGGSRVAQDSGSAPRTHCPANCLA